MPFSYNECWNAARDVLDALEAVGEPYCCLVGGMAAKLHGVNRPIKDLDIIVLSPSMDEEDIQDALVEYSDGFYLEEPQNPDANFMKLRFMIPRTHRSIKVDLLLSHDPEIEIPRAFKSNHIVTKDGLETAPLDIVLYHKLLGWECRAYADEYWKRDKADGRDYEDIISLCDIMHRQRIQPLNTQRIGHAYVRRFEQRAQDFAHHYYGPTFYKLRRIGFAV